MFREKENTAQDGQKLQASKATQTQLRKRKAGKLQASQFKENKHKWIYVKDMQFASTQLSKSINREDGKQVLAGF